MILHGIYDNGNISLIDENIKIEKRKFKVEIIPSDDETDIFDYIQTKRMKRNVPDMTEKEIEDIIHNLRDK